MRQLLCIILVWLALSQLALALTPGERKIVQSAQTDLRTAIKDYNAAKDALGAADQRAAEAEKHAVETDGAAALLRNEIDLAYAREAALAKENAKMRPVYEECSKYWGFGAIGYGFKQLIKHLFIALIVAAVLAIAISVLSAFFPAIGAVLGLVVRGFGSFLGLIASAAKGVLGAIGSLFKRKPAVISPQPASAPTTPPVSQPPPAI